MCPLVQSPGALAWPVTEQEIAPPPSRPSLGSSPKSPCHFLDRAVHLISLIPRSALYSLPLFHGPSLTPAWTTFRSTQTFRFALPLSRSLCAACGYVRGLQMPLRGQREQIVPDYGAGRETELTAGRGQARAPGRRWLWSWVGSDDAEGLGRSRVKQPPQTGEAGASPRTGGVLTGAGRRVNEKRWKIKGGWLRVEAQRLVGPLTLCSRRTDT